MFHLKLNSTENCCSLCCETTPQNVSLTGCVILHYPISSSYLLNYNRILLHAPCCCMKPDVEDSRSWGGSSEGHSVGLGSLGWHRTVNKIVPPLVTAADGERAPGFTPRPVGTETEQPCTKYPATDWTMLLKMQWADKMLRGAELTCLRRPIITLTWYLL